MSEVVISVHKVASVLSLPSRSSWGEAWWTARDICLTNQPELTDWQAELSASIERKIARDLVFGSSSC